MFGQRHSKLKDIKRLREIANALIKAELGNVLEKLKLKSYLTFKKKVDPLRFKKPVHTMPERLRIAFDDLGGSFVKFGQLLSLRYDILPKEYCEEFSKLQDSVRPVNFSTIKKIVEEELGKSIETTFKKFEKTPIAAASVGQVHKAILKDGTIVAIKVQRPNIEEVFKTDIDLYFHLAKLITKHYPKTKNYDPKGLIEEFEHYTTKELDYTIEGKNIDVFYENFKNDPNVKIPKVYWDYTSKRMLVMEFIEGKKISEIKQFQKLRSSRKKVVENVLEAVTKQILEHKVFHADPHPGNILLIKDNKIAFLDFGIVGRITEDMEQNIEDYLIGAINRDPEYVVRSFVNSGSVEEGIDIRQFKADLSETMADYYDVSLQQINLAGMMQNIFTLARRHKIKVPLSYVLYGKTLITLQGFISKYYPEFNFIQFMKPKIGKLMKRRYGPDRILTSIKTTAVDFKDLVRNLPSDISGLIRAIKYGTKVNIEVDHKELKNFTLELDRSSNRLTFGIILAALIIAGSLLITFKVEPLIKGVPLLVYIIGVFIFLISISLMISILKEGKGGENE